jgi:hypothetical protein
MSPRVCDTCLTVDGADTPTGFVEACMDLALPCRGRRRLHPLQNAVRFSLREARKAKRVRVAAADEFVRWPELPTV